MNTHAPNQQACNTQVMTLQWALLTLQCYGSSVETEYNIVSIPSKLQFNPPVMELRELVASKGWHIQNGVLS